MENYSELVHGELFRQFLPVENLKIKALICDGNFVGIDISVHISCSAH